MGRPRSFDEDEAAEAILDAFWSRGYGATSIAHLREATGLLAGSLYSAFGSKEAMFRGALDRYLVGLAADLATDRRGVDAIRDILDAVVRITVDDSERRGCLLINAIPESERLPSDLRSRLRGGLETMRKIMRGHLEEADLAPGADLEDLASLLLAASVSIRVLGRAGLARRTLQQVADGAVAAIPTAD